MDFSEDELVERISVDLRTQGRHWASYLPASHASSLEKRLQAEFPRVLRFEYGGGEYHHYQSVYVDNDFEEADLKNLEKIAEKREVMMLQGRINGLPE